MNLFSQTAPTWKVSISKVKFAENVKVKHPSASYSEDEGAPAGSTFVLVLVELTSPNPEAKLRLEDIALVEVSSTKYPALGISPRLMTLEFSLLEEQRSAGGFSVTSDYSFIANASGTILNGSSSPSGAYLLFAVPTKHKALSLQIGDARPVALPKVE